MHNKRSFLDSFNFSHSNSLLTRRSYENVKSFQNNQCKQTQSNENNIKISQRYKNKNDNDYLQLRKTYHCPQTNNWMKDLRQYNNPENYKLLRSTVQGNICNIFPKNQKDLTLSYAGSSKYINTPSSFTTTSKKPGYKIDQYILGKQIQKQTFPSDLNQKLGKSVKIIDEIKKLKNQRQNRIENHRIQQLKSLQIKRTQKNTSTNKNPTFLKKNYYEYYTPKFDKIAYQERFIQSNKSNIQIVKRGENAQKKQSCQINEFSKNDQSHTPVDYHSKEILFKIQENIQIEDFLNKKINYTIYDFQITKNLGQGQFGNVFLARHKETSSFYAIKKIPKSIIKQNMMVDQLVLEIKLQSFLNHQNILKIYGCCDDEEYVYLVLQYMQEGTLYKLLKSKKSLQEQEASKYIKQISSAIFYLHQRGIVHRDIKPQNIVMTNDICKLCDFGWATVCNERRKTYCGTFDYAAPQILEGNCYDITVDLWCLGILAYELMVGKAPFYHVSKKQTMKRIISADLSALNFPQNLSKNARSFIDGLLRKNPEERLKSQDLLLHPFLANISQ